MVYIIYQPLSTVYLLNNGVYNISTSKYCISLIYKKNSESNESSTANGRERKEKIPEPNDDLNLFFIYLFLQDWTLQNSWETPRRRRMKVNQLCGYIENKRKTKQVNNKERKNERKKFCRIGPYRTVGRLRKEGA